MSTENEFGITTAAFVPSTLRDACRLNQSSRLGAFQERVNINLISHAVLSNRRKRANGNAIVCPKALVKTTQLRLLAYIVN